MEGVAIKPTLYVISQGCAANFGEGEQIGRAFEKEYDVRFGMPQNAPAGTAENKNSSRQERLQDEGQDQHEISGLEPPATFVLNVCTVKGNAGALKLLRQALATAPDSKIFITGCAPQDFREEALKLTPRITFTDVKALTQASNTSKVPRPQMKPLRESPLVGIVNIETGCLDACSYCSTRLVKGRLQSYPAGLIVEQIQQLVADGCREIQLTGQDCGCYGFDFGERASLGNPAGDFSLSSAREPRNLAELVKKILLEVPGNYRIRLGMGNPRHILRYKEALMDCFNDERVYKFIHLPVQSGSERTLQAMNRKHTAREYADLANEFNKSFSRFTLSTDLIVGFPGETEQDFADTMSILRETRPTVCNITRFVSRPGTPASRLTNTIPDEIKHSRSAELAAAFQAIAQQNNSRWVGDVETVTIEKEGYRPGTLIARNDAYRPVALQMQGNAHYAPGTRLQVCITAAEPFALLAKVL